MKKKDLAATAWAFFLTGVLSGPSFATSAALDQLKAQAESLGAATPAPAQTPSAAPVPPQEPHVSGPERLIEDIQWRIAGAIGYFVYTDLPRLEPAGNHDLEIAINHAAMQYAHVFLKKECPISLPLGNWRSLAPGVYRSGFPTQEGFAQLKQMGIKTVLSLLQPDEVQAMGHEPEELTVTGLGLSYVDIPVNPTKWPSFQQIDQALDIMLDPSKQPVLLHCTCGNDRTGIFSAAYRVVVQGWTPEQAAVEAKEFYWKFPAFGDLATFLSSYAQYRAGAVSPQPAPVVTAK